MESSSPIGARLYRRSGPDAECRSGPSAWGGLPNYLPTSDIRVLATLHLPLSYYPSRVLDPARPRTWFNAVSAAQSQPIRSHSSIVATIENGVAAPHGPAPAKESFALAMGRICPEKGFHLALEAARAA